MNPPDRPKRPSARPSQRPSVPPPQATPVAATPEPLTGAPVVSAEPSSVPPPPAGDLAGNAGSASRARVSARRPSTGKRREGSERPPADLTEEAAASAAPAQPVSEVPAPPASIVVPAQHAAEVVARPSKRPSSVAPRGVFEAQPELSRPSVTPLKPQHEEDDDIWRDSAPMPDVVDGSRAAASDTTDLEREHRTGMRPATRLARGSSASEPRGDAAAIGSAKSLLSTDYYFRQYGAHGMRSLSADVDEFGLDPHVEESARPVLETLCKHYFRVTVEGAQHLPTQGKALMVANRSGALPWDGLVLRTALRMERSELPPLRWLSEDSVFHYPFLGVFMNRLGAVRACQENAERLLAQDKLVVAFPEGAQGSRKLFRDRYQLQRFGRGGYVKLALKLGAPIIPTAIIGAEETNPVLANSRVLARLLGSEHFPITPTFPWLGPMGLLPAPIKWRILIGDPIELDGYGPEAAEDVLLVHRLNEQIRGILQGLLTQGKNSRRSVLFG
ncbi:MAG: 1-acyl-sn-glycerol-3-phosphate acyltransferase [Myxococcales bacterium]